MIQPWIDIPVKDIHLSLPLSMQDNSVRIMFRSTEAIDETIEKLKNLRDIVEGTEILAHV